MSRLCGKPTRLSSNESSNGAMSRRAILHGGRIFDVMLRQEDRDVAATAPGTGETALDHNTG